jgi:hypothetical protein
LYQGTTSVVPLPAKIVRAFMPLPFFRQARGIHLGNYT